MNMKNENTRKLVFTAMFAALCCVATYLIVIPVPGGFGYVNLGDIFVLLAGWCLGGVYGGVAAGVGSALADLWSGYAIYSPVTLFLKAGVALIGYYLYIVCKKVIKKECMDCISRLIAAITAEIFMAVGYFVFEWALYGLAAAVAGLPFNFLQGGCAVVCVVALLAALYPMPIMHKIFPALKYSWR